MSEIVKVHVHLVTEDKQHSDVAFEPTEQGNTLALKQQIAKILSKYKSTHEYYYVVIELEKSDGKPTYRTIVKKTFLNA